MRTQSWRSKLIEHMVWDYGEALEQSCGFLIDLGVSVGWPEFNR
jgi:hypothetical protein